MGGEDPRYKFLGPGESHTKLYKLAKERKIMPEQDFGEIVSMLE